ncbi:RNA polymerase II subunit A C-terminal domain phosphatase [Blastocladiella emersonii ATCC 22665]|nr:RNA polymerase II subunit A C-terminal domain phosphatase [Blastocladiella emersonii ATCC 22665]
MNPSDGAAPKPQKAQPQSKYRYAVVCASNMNRSMHAHLMLQELGFRVASFGTGSAVRLPGPSIDKPNVYEFGTAYETIHSDLRSRDAALYTTNGLLAMLDRNKRIKRAPQRWQDRGAAAAGADAFDVVLTCEERVFDAVVDDAQRVLPKGAVRPVHVVNLEIRDTAADAAVGAAAIAALVRDLEAREEGELDADLPAALRAVQAARGGKGEVPFAMLHAVCYLK